MRRKAFLSAGSEDPVAVTVRTHGRARRLILKVFDDGAAELVVPPGTPPGSADRFLRQHANWLLAEVVRRRTPPAEPPRELHLAAVGEHWGLDLRERITIRRVRAVLRPSSAPDRFTLRVDLPPGASAADARKAVRQALVRRVRSRYLDWLNALAPALDVQFNRLQVRNQRSVWGSCSSNGTISLNYAGIFLRPELAHYLCAHELTHRRHMDHSRAFWRCLETRVPDARALDAQLGTTRDVVPRWLW